jgi:hypothetical protein
MNGGTWEYVLGNFNKTVGSSSITSLYSGFYTNYTKYYDNYTVESKVNRILGDATGEIAGWYNDYSDFIYSSVPWFYRGGLNIRNTQAGSFAFFYYTGEARNDHGGRLVLAPTA